MLGQGDVVLQSPGSAAAAGRIRGRFSSSSPRLRKLLGGAALHVSVLVPSQGRSRTRGNYCSRTSSWRYQPPSGHGQSSHNGRPHPESFRWRWIWDPCDADHLPLTQVSAPACLPCPRPASSSCQGECGWQSAGRRPILFNYVQSNSHREEGSQEEMPLKSEESRCTVWSEQERMLSLACTHHPGPLHLCQLNPEIYGIPSQTSRTCL